MNSSEREMWFIKLGTVFLLLVIIVYCAGCSTMKPVPESPDVEIQEVKIEVPCIIQIEQIQCADLPEAQAREAYPDLKSWAKEVRRVTKLRETILISCVAALQHQIKEHNKLEPRCLE